jgi:hypothetical protein
MTIIAANVMTPWTTGGLGNANTTTVESTPHNSLREQRGTPP